MTSDVSSEKATTMYAIRTALAATAADPPLMMELSNKYWQVKKVVKGRKTMAAVKSMSFLTTELQVRREQYNGAKKLYVRWNIGHFDGGRDLWEEVVVGGELVVHAEMRGGCQWRAAMGINFWPISVVGKLRKQIHRQRATFLNL